jgi:hypothetical protein
VDAPFSLTPHRASSRSAGRIAFRASEVALSVTLVVEAIAAVGLAVAWLVPTDYDVADMTRIAHVSYLPWIPAALDILLATVVAAIGAIAATGLWQDAWGRRRQVGRLKAQAAWGALLIQPACAAFLILRADGPLQHVRVPPAAFVGLGAVAAGLVVVIRGAIFVASGWKRIASVALVVLVALGGAVWAGRVYAGHSATRANDTPIAPPLPGQVYPARSVVCAGSIARACAREAADRMGFTVAWAQLPPNPRLALVVYEPAAHVFESLRLAQTSVTLTSGDEKSHYLTPPLRTVRAHGDTAEVRTDAGSAVSFAWIHRGHHFTLFVLWSRGGVGQPRMDAALDIWRSVRYAAPPTARH